MVPPPYRDANGQPIQHNDADLDRDTLLRALSDMASYLAEKGITAHIITVGGAVNTLYLRSRQSTHDVDFFLADPSSQEHHAIHEAARHANRQTNGRLGGEWFNNSTQLFMAQGIQQTLASRALEQNIVVYEHVDRHGGLRLYAAPWAYAFCGKLNRLCDSNPRPYDLEDAIQYLRQHLETEGRQTVSAHRIRQWCQTFGKKVEDRVLRDVDRAYHQKWREHPIGWHSQS